MTPDDWQTPMRIEENYRSALQRLFRVFADMIAGAGITDPYDVLKYLAEWVNGNFYPEMAFAAASRMVTGLHIDGAKNWREAARESMKGRMIYEALRNEMQGPVGATVQRIINENARLISTFPEGMARLVNNFIKEESQKGRRSDDIAKNLIDQFPNVAESRIKLIARTETSKASTALTRARADKLGLSWFVWRTSKDSRVRKSHQLMDRVLCSWSDLPSPELLNHEKKPPAPYAPGCIYNCRCYPQPLISYDDIKWPAKVHQNNTITYMTRSQFVRISEGGLAYAA